MVARDRLTTFAGYPPASFRSVDTCNRLLLESIRLPFASERPCIHACFHETVGDFVQSNVRVGTTYCRTVTLLFYFYGIAA